MIVLGVLVPDLAGAELRPPTAWPLGQAGLHLAAEGVELVFGQRLTQGLMRGHVPTAEGWRATTARPLAFYDRFPSQGRAATFRRLLRNLEGRPLGNPWAFTLLCRDKLRSQRILEDLGVAMPEVEHRPAWFGRRLRDWGAGFLKPRFGSLGAGVRLVLPGDELPSRLPGVQGALEPAILQRAIAPPPGLAGSCLRVLAQRDPDGRWVQAPVVHRWSQDDPVVNVERGAQVQPGVDSLDATTALRVALCVDTLLTALDRLPGEYRALEVGIDLVLDPGGDPHLIELNGRPRGRLQRLAEDDPHRFAEARLSTLLRPLRTLAAWGKACR